MAADQTLIQGAYRAAMADTKASKLLAKSKGISGITQGLTGIAVDYLGQKTEEKKYYEGLAQGVLNEAEDLSTEDFGDLFDKLEAGKQDYVWGTKKQKTLSLRNLNLTKESYEYWGEIRDNLAESVLEKDGEGNINPNRLSEHFKQSEEGKFYQSLLDGQAKLVTKKCPEGTTCQDEGKPGIMVPNLKKLDEAKKMLKTMEHGRAGISIDDIEAYDTEMDRLKKVVDSGGGEWTPLSTIEQTINNNRVDKTFANGLGKLMDTNIQLSSNVKEGQEAKFPRNFNESSIRNLLANSNKKSVAYDKMFGKASFYEDLVEDLSGKGWRDLNIDPETILNLDPTKEDGITRDDAIFIAKTLINDEQYDNFLTEEMITYFTGFTEQNYNVDGAELRIETSPDYILNKGGTRTKKTESNEYMV